MRTVNFESIAVSTTAIGFTAANLVRDAASPPSAAHVQVLEAPINIRQDGTNPTGAAGGGTRYEPNSVFVVSSLPDMANFRAIRVTDAAQDARINVTFMA